ncbi:glycosyltransferase family 2 protein [Moritella dasanensis]|uniref:glycosyltransferase family 2 protein n=1 Tax=Moritella dasanensis TaxID=428031 RepID=UPI0002FD6B3C
MNKIFISIVSHNHIEIIKKLNCLKQLSNDKSIEIVVKENTRDDNYAYYKSISVNYINNSDLLGKGFGENNNIIFNYCIDKLNMMNDDIFIVLNPDVYITEHSLKSLVDKMIFFNDKFVAINLFKDFEEKTYDNSIRKFPSFYSFFSSLVFSKNNTTYNKLDINNRSDVEWGAGSFLAFRTSHYKLLKGFNEKYFMYCEDIDICYRSYIVGHSLVYYPDVKAIHLAKHENRKLCSKHFFWHIKSAMRFIFYKAFNDFKKKIID